MNDESIPLFVSFSSGRTSAFMAYFLKLRYPNRPMVFGFANTGKEKEASLRFAHQCDQAFGLDLVWLEAVIHPEIGVGTTHKVVDFKSAARHNDFRQDPTTPFEEMIKKYGIPNKAFPHCTRELKIRPIHHYIRNVLGWTDYQTAIGYRTDEKHRAKYRKGEVYPLIDLIAATEPFIRAWWARQPFDLELKDYEGNCDLCWKKSVRKQLTLLQEMPSVGDWWNEMEHNYRKLVNGEPIHFFRNNQSTQQLIALAKRPFSSAVDKQQLRLLNHPLFEPELDLEMHCLCDAS